MVLFPGYVEIMKAFTRFYTKGISITSIASNKLTLTAMYLADNTLRNVFPYLDPKTNKKNCFAAAL